MTEVRAPGVIRCLLQTDNGQVHLEFGDDLHEGGEPRTLYPRDMLSHELARGTVNEVVWGWLRDLFGSAAILSATIDRRLLVLVVATTDDLHAMGMYEGGDYLVERLAQLAGVEPPTPGTTDLIHDAMKQLKWNEAHLLVLKELQDRILHWARTALESYRVI